MISFDPRANNIPTPDKEIKAPTTPINSSFLLPNFSIFKMATNVKAELTTPTSTAPRNELSTLLIASLSMLGAKYIIAAIPLRWENIGKRTPIRRGTRRNGANSSFSPPLSAFTISLISANWTSACSFPPILIMVFIASAVFPLVTSHRGLSGIKKSKIKKSNAMGISVANIPRHISSTKSHFNTPPEPSSVMIPAASPALCRTIQSIKNARRIPSVMESW